ncbi:hypothetical protein [Haloarchaeobius sp. DYHT-AS-18]
MRTQRVTVPRPMLATAVATLVLSAVAPGAGLFVPTLCRDAERS